MTAIERAYEMARSGRYANFTEIKRALRGEFSVERDLYGRHLHAELTRLCRVAKMAEPA